jgi:hypothetical protein
MMKEQALEPGGFIRSYCWESIPEGDVARYFLSIS